MEQLSFTAQGHLSWPHTQAASPHPVGFISQGAAEGSYATSEAKPGLAVSGALLRLHAAHRKPVPATLTLHPQPSPSAARATLGAERPITPSFFF